MDSMDSMDSMDCAKNRTTASSHALFFRPIGLISPIGLIGPILRRPTDNTDDTD